MNAKARRCGSAQRRSRLWACVARRAQPAVWPASSFRRFELFVYASQAFAAPRATLAQSDAAKALSKTPRKAAFAAASKVAAKSSAHASRSRRLTSATDTGRTPPSSSSASVAWDRFSTRSVAPQCLASTCTRVVLPPPGSPTKRTGSRDATQAATRSSSRAACGVGANLRSGAPPVVSSTTRPTWTPRGVDVIWGDEARTRMRRWSGSSPKASATVASASAASPRHRPSTTSQASTAASKRLASGA